VSDALRIGGFVAPLVLDTFALAIALGLRGEVAPLRVGVVCAVFEGLMPLVGAALALIVPARFATGAIVLAALVLVGLGIHALREASENRDETAGVSFGTPRAVLLAGLAISTDELAVGFPLATSGLPIATTLLALAAGAFASAYAGVALGRRLGRAASRLAATGAGVGFILLGIFLAADHLRR